MQRLIKNFKQAVNTLWQERWNALAGGMVFVVLCAVVILLSSCTTPPTSFDPNLESVRMQLTSDSYEGNAQLLSLMATGTAQAPIMAITQTAAELNFSQTQISMQKTEIAASWTHTPSPTTTITLTPTPNATATALMLLSQAEATQVTLDLQSKERSNEFWALAPVILFATLIGAICYVAISYSRSQRRKPVARDEFGKTQPIIDNVTGQYLDLNASPNYSHITKSLFEQIVIQWLEKKYGFVPDMPRITDARQDRIKEREQVIEIERIRHRRLPKALIDAQGMKFLPAPTDEMEEGLESERYPELPLPSWVQLNKWDGRLLPVGTDENSNLMLVNTSLRPHLLYAGRSRSGKTLTGERTSVACLLTKGWNVIVMGKRVDWMPFTDHPNFKLLAVDVRKDARKYIDILQILSAQMDIRDSLLASKGIETWDRYGAPSTMVVLDDYSGALIRMPKPQASEVISEVRNIALDGAKFGLSITIGLQDATAQNIDTTTRSQMARIVYSMDNAGKSRVALGTNGRDGDGAERLPPFRHFLARVSDDSDIRRGVGFFLQNNEVEAFLASRPVKQNGEMEWVDGVIVDQPELSARTPIHLSAPAPTQSLSEFVNGRSPWEVKALNLYQAGVDQAQIVEEVFAGDNLEIGAVAVADLIKRWQVVKGATPANSPQTPESAQNVEAQIDAQIRSLHAQNVANTNIVYKIWDKSSAEFSDRMARVKRVLATASASEVTEVPQNEPLTA